MINTKKLPNNWKLITIRDCCDLVMGQSPPGSSYNEIEKGIPFLQGKSEFGKTFPNHIKFTTDPKRNAKKGSILMSVRAPVGDVNIANIDYCIGRGLASINLKNGNNQYLFYLLNYLKPKIEQYGTGSTFKAINKSGLEKIKIPVPPIEIQMKIVEILEKAEELKELRSTADAFTDEYLKSLFLEMFGDINLNNKNWELKKINDLTEVKTGGTPSRKIREYWETGIIPWVKTTEVKGSIIKNVQEFITNEGLRNCNASLFPKNTILVAMYGQGKTRGRCGKLGIKASTNQACAAILPSNKYNTDYLWYFLEVSYENLRKLGRGGNQPNLNLSMIKNFEIPNPPLELQNQFAKIAQRVETLKIQQFQSKEAINNLFRTLTQKAFNGELVC